MTDPGIDAVGGGRFRPVLRERNLVRLLVGETISNLGSAITSFAFAIVAVVMLEASPRQMGLIRALGELPAVALGLFVGLWVDRFSRRRLLVSLNLLAAVAVASVPVSYLAGTLSIGQLYVLSVAFGILGAFWEPAWNAFLPSVVTNDQLVDANSKLTVSGSATGVVGPGLAGILVDVLTAPIAMVGDAMSFVVAALSVRGVRSRERPIPSEEDRAPIRRRIGEGLRVAFFDPMQRAITAPQVLLYLVDALSLSVYVIFTLRVVGLSPASLGVVLMVGAASFLAGSAVAPRIERRIGAGRAALLGLALVGASPFTMLLAAESHPLWLNLFFLGFPALLGGFGGIIQAVMLISLRQAITPERAIGRVYGSIGVLGGLMTICGALIGGALGETIGPRLTILVAAFGYTVPFFWSLFTPLRTATTAPSGAAPEPPATIEPDA
jgi:MFS family permease